MKTLTGIQYLRALAALAVVIFHAADRTGLHFAIGAAGVDVFFVISGFVMQVMNARRPATPGQFLLERGRRIVPLYWIVSAVMIAGAFFGLFPNMVLSLPHVLGSLFFIPVRSPSSGEIWPVLVQGWTLNFEMFFYAVFAGSLLLRRPSRLAAIAAIFSVLVAAGLAIQSDNPIVLTYTQPIVLEFVAGMVLGELWLKGRIPSAGIGLALASSGLLGFALIHILKLEFNALICGPLAVALVLGTLAIEKGGRMPDLPALRYAGNASYSIYLWHALAISVVAKIAAAAALPAAIVFVVAVAGGLAVGVIAYEGIERPLNGWLKRKNAVAPYFRMRLSRLIRVAK